MPTAGQAARDEPDSTSTAQERNPRLRSEQLSARRGSCSLEYLGCLLTKTAGCVVVLYPTSQSRQYHHNQHPQPQVSVCCVYRDTHSVRAETHCSVHKAADSAFVVGMWQAHAPAHGKRWGSCRLHTSACKAHTECAHWEAGFHSCAAM